MKREKNKRMKKNFEDLRNHAIKQATGRGPSMPALGGVLQPSLPDCFEEVHRELNLLPEDQAITSTLVARAYRTKVPKTSKTQAQLIDPKFEIIKCGSKVPVHISKLPKPIGIYAFDEWDGEDINKHTTFDDFTHLNSIGNPVGNTFPWLERAVYDSNLDERKRRFVSFYSSFILYSYHFNTILDTVLIHTFQNDDLFYNTNIIDELPKINANPNHLHIYQNPHIRFVYLILGSLSPY